METFQFQEKKSSERLDSSSIQILSYPRSNRGLTPVFFTPLFDNILIIILDIFRAQI